ncbi:hypothetical protein A3B32_02980 [Candidatus Uhrbacteria bacterium RIFCSPLOWO2_01_FULL_53_9]|uniref:Response regulatory domain-containing protein n=3 Tax=Candidatus Uhriibacteriota TaxID=1752732 RepID=A0A1F7UYW2_9BACT|nr:MAG: hypothetical protein A3C17_02490 [Candidatus Uhrbacteria bacterium RIFCSPHIGHO2_02_FULL_53_13]OGL83455.1 MAG: hypothetical protein A3B32_02980 [Candidatus Uhrbacteria bacterium RIFCSPLOWO2_01_FULL_53_9]OGL89506.1 MAG: hypothetical protein A3I45_00265 [Candidatus Uhrbacteria bacterium RIFCSPLOWO2_02_FULL_53_10]
MKRHVCIIDTDPFFAGLVARKCEQQNFKTTVIESFDHAERCLDEEVDAVILDVALHEDDAAEVIHQLRTARTGHVPVVVFTEHHDPKTIARLRREGADAYLIKGHFLPKEAVEKVARIIESKVV